MFKAPFCVLGLVSLITSGSALADEGIQWDLHDQTVTYRIQTDIRSPLPLVIQASRNEEFASHHVQSVVSTHCSSEAPRGKQAWEMRCVLDDIAIRAQPRTGSPEKAQRILDEWVAELKGAAVQFVLKRDGRVRSVDLEKTQAGNRRDSAIHTQMEMILSRAFSGLDGHMPKDGTDGGAGVWSVKHALTMATPSVDGSMGAVKGKAQIVKRDGVDLYFTSNVAGVRQTGSTEPGQVGLAYEMTLSDSVVFDVENGSLSGRHYVVQGVPTATSESPVEYMQQGVVERLTNDTVAFVGESAPSVSNGWLDPMDGSPSLVLADAE